MVEAASRAGCATRRSVASAVQQAPWRVPHKSTSTSVYRRRTRSVRRHTPTPSSMRHPPSRPPRATKRLAPHPQPAAPAHPLEAAGSGPGSLWGAGDLGRAALRVGPEAGERGSMARGGGGAAGVPQPHVAAARRRVRECRRGGQPRRRSAAAARPGGDQPPLHAPPPSRRGWGAPRCGLEGGEEEVGE